MMENEMYTVPVVEIIEVEVEKGFAVSGDDIYGGAGSSDIVNP